MIILNNINYHSWQIEIHDKIDEILVSPDLLKILGMPALDLLLQRILKKFPQIAKIIINLGDSHMDVFNCLKLGYQNLVYTGKSDNIKRIISKYAILHETEL